ncbi:MAG: ribonuclease J [Anaerolineaceae bacterium]|jgi:ribonuclease J|nr:ribonuclease J [Anaerolineaceae bacterium]MDI9532006.1 ribonuclease J [Chloroflexota bacterium]NLE93119.1 ribonuclease J [Chloroflexota bacterium]HOF28481.1 ribonuclease J [Anaerolineaceae bacterium]
MSNKTLRIIPLGGLGEVGKNMTVYEYNQQILIVDAGLMFPDNDMIGIDYIIPDFEYVKERASKVKGIIITHGHEDHTGAIGHLLEYVNAPVYATPLTNGLIKNKLNRRGMAVEPKLVDIQAGESVQIGPFKVDFFHVCHSVPDGVGIGIDTPAGLVVHTGDYKLDHTPIDGRPTDYGKLAEFARKGVLALLADSTNAERPGWTASERVINDAFEKVFYRAKGRIIVATFASLISRMQQVLETAKKHDRKVSFVGLSMTENVRIARELGYLSYDEDQVVSTEQALSMPDDQVVLMVTGSQGEPTSILGRLANGTNNRFSVKEGDTIVLSSHPIPGNEESVYRAINRLMEKGAEVVYEAIMPVHVSGHASQEEIKLLLHLVKPRYLIPIHGELRMLKQHKRLALEVGMDERQIALVENGRVIEFTHGEMTLKERIPGGYVFVDGIGVGDVDRSTMRDRTLLSQDGVVLLNIELDKNNGVFKDLEIISRGFIAQDEAQELFAELRKRVVKLTQYPANNLQKEIQSVATSFINEETKRRPVIFVTISKA